MTTILDCSFVRITWTIYLASLLSLDFSALTQEWHNTKPTQAILTCSWAPLKLFVHFCDLQDPWTERQRRTLEAVNHVGVAIVSSAITTVISTVPLFFCTIMPFSKFGQIVAINTAISILFTLVVTTALLATMGPSHFTRPPRAVLKASLVVLAVGFSGCLFWWTGSQLIPTSWSSLIN